MNVQMNVLMNVQKTAGRSRMFAYFETESKRGPAQTKRGQFRRLQWRFYKIIRCYRVIRILHVSVDCYRDVESQTITEDEVKQPIGSPGERYPKSKPVKLRYRLPRG